MGGALERGKKVCPVQQNGSAFQTAHQFFPHGVLLPIPKAQKGPRINGWQKLTFEATQTPEFQALLQAADNIGLLLGVASGNIIDIDLDSAAAVKRFCELNLRLVNNTLQTVGSRGRHFFFRIKGPYPQKVVRLEQPGQEHVGEWRGGGGAQTVISGIHSSGCLYRIVNGVPALEIEIEELNWPPEWVTPSNEEKPQEVVENFQRLRQGVLTGIELAQLDIPVRRSVIGSWCKAGDLVFIFGERGSGKTWLASALGCYAARGRDLFEWEITQAWNVLWLDGEMPLSDFRDRIVGLCDDPVAKLSLIHHEHFHSLGLGSLNLAQPATQQALNLLCLERGTEILVLDNLSCLFSGMLENDADEWEKVLPWLLELRRMGITVFIVAHAGRNKQMRGTSKREDSASSIIKVELVLGRDDSNHDAHFSSTFTKQRSGESLEGLREWIFKTNSDGEVEIASQTKGFDEQVYELIKLGIDTATEIALELGCAKSTVSKAAKRMIGRKLIFKKGRAYQCVKLTGEK